MKVARSRSLSQTLVEHVDDPFAGPGEVVCDVLACGVCGSDVTDWYVERKLPAVLGHEPVGIVSEVGPGVMSVAVGDRVAIHHHAPCGDCRRCLRGFETLCTQFRSTALVPGGFAERVLVGADLLSELLPLPESLDPVAATFIEPIGCIVRSQDRAGLVAGDRLLVVGAGAMGLLQVAAARARGVDAVWVREPRAERLALAREWGALPYDDEPVDVAIVCTPKPIAIAGAVAALDVGGRLCLYSPPAPTDPPVLDGTAIFMRELTVTASYSAGPADMRAALELIVSGAIDPLPLISHRFDLDGVGEALDLQRRGEAMKAVILP